MAKIEIDLADLGVTYNMDGEPEKVEMQDLIIAEAARQLTQSIDGDFERTVRDKVNDKIDSITKERVVEIINEVLEGPIQRTSHWGEPKGEPTTVREIIRKKIETFLNATPRYDRYSNSSDPGNLEDLLTNITKTQMVAELKPVIDEAKKSIHTQVTSVALKAAVEALTPKA